MRKILFAIMLLMVMSPVLAIDYWHSSDTYTIELDGEGDAFIVAEMQFELISEENISEITLEIPGSNVEVYKIIQYMYPYYGGTRTTSQPRPGGAPSTYYDDIAYPEPKSTIEFLDYEKEVYSDFVILNIKLKRNLTLKQQGNIAIVYQTNAIGKETFQGIEFKFETIKDINSVIRFAGANIIVPGDMTLKGKPEFDIDYKPSYLARQFQTETADVGAALATAGLMSNYKAYTPPRSNRVHYSVNNIDPGESFTIKGLYGDNSYLLYIWEFLATIAIVIMFLFFAKSFRLWKKIKDLFSPKIHFKKNGFSLERSLGMGLISGLFFSISFIFVTILSGITSNLPYAIREILQLMTTLLAVLLIGASLFLPMFYSFKRQGIKGVLGSAITALTTIIIFLVAFFSIFQGHFF